MFRLLSDVTYVLWSHVIPLLHLPLLKNDPMVAFEGVD